ncbi:MAG: hypothetical protein CMJ39_01005 [Phycisphaerae bacterium]|nr:hypothetical protein [Phycisphaerae bacterium]|tara:strand:+ start:1090 stop:1569 length:480 start_codon:yes stop_codon:yes gene_type:complete
MHHLEARIQRLERSRSRNWLLILAILSGLPLLMALAGTGLIPSGDSAVSERLVTRSLVIVDESNRPRIGLGVDEEIGSSIFIRDETGRPAVSLAALSSGGSISILNDKGQQVAVLSTSGTGDGQLRLSDSQGRTVGRIGRWAGEEKAGIRFYEHDDPVP